MQHVLPRPHPVPEHPGQLLGEDGQDHESCQQRIQGELSSLQPQQIKGIISRDFLAYNHH